jgi:proteasome lid subunit RPN8/RPN11
LQIQEEKIIISREAYERIVIYGSRYANNDFSNKMWREVYGVLVGYLDENNNTVVKNAIPIVVGDSAGVKYENKQYALTALIDENVYERTIKEQGKDFFVGWWHTHPGFGFFFSDTDKMTHLGYQQNNPFAIGIIYDHCERDSNGLDAGIEVLRLEDIKKNIMSPYIFVKFEIEESEKVVGDIGAKLSKILPKLEDIHQDIVNLDTNLKKKAFAQLQRNYGLLLVKKLKSEIDDENSDDLEEDEKYLYEWNEEYIKKTFRVPKFRERIEKMIKDAEKIKDKKGKDTRVKVEKLLENPKNIVIKIKDEFYQIKDRANIYQDFLDADEKKMLELMEARIGEYIDILNDLITKAYNIAPD